MESEQEVIEVASLVKLAENLQGYPVPFYKYARFILKKHGINPFMPIRLFYFNYSDRYISSRRGVWFIFIITMFYRYSCI